MGRTKGLRVAILARRAVRFYTIDMDAERPLLPMTRFGLEPEVPRLRALTLSKMPAIPGVIAPRPLWLVTLLTVVTFGIYGLLWIRAVSRELREATNDAEIRPTRNAVLTFLTCSLWAFVVAWDLDGRVQAQLARMDPSHKPRYLDFLALVLVNFVLPGVGLLIAQALLQRDLNELARTASRAHGHAALTTTP
jgi:hypothetical protein